jgi:hypothetical protein
VPGGHLPGFADGFVNRRRLPTEGAIGPEHCRTAPGNALQGSPRAVSGTSGPAVGTMPVVGTGKSIPRGQSPRHEAYRPGDQSGCGLRLALDQKTGIGRNPLENQRFSTLSIANASIP